MKEIKNLEVIDIGNGITVKPYLTYAEIQSVVNAVCQFDNWSDRKQNIDILLMHFATNMTDKEIETTTHEALLQSGIIDKVKENVINFNMIDEAINYTESTQRALAQIIKEFPVILDNKIKELQNGRSKK